MNRILLVVLFTSFTTNLLAQVDLSNGVISCYSFSGNPDDGSGNNNHGVLNGPTTGTDRFGNANSAYFFDGADRIVIPSAPLVNQEELSVSSWAYIESNPSWGDAQMVFTIGDPFSPYFYGQTLTHHYSSADFTGWGIGGANKDFESIAAFTNFLPSEHTWYHLVLTIKLDTVTMYINGMKAGKQYTGGRPLCFFQEAASVAYIGMRSNGMQGFHGKLDDITIYNRVITRDEVTSLYQGGLPCGEIQPPVVNNVTICDGGVATLMAPSGSAYRWYDAATDGNLVFEGNPYVVPGLISTTSFYVSKVVVNEESLRVKVTVTVNQCPVSPPNVDNIAICENDPAILTAAGGTLYRWYDAQTGGNLLFEGNPFRVAALTSTTSYYVSNKEGDKESIRISVTVTVNSNPVLTCNFPEEDFPRKQVMFKASASVGKPPYLYKYDLGDGTNVSTQASSFFYTYHEEGQYQVGVMVVDANGCVDVCQSELTIEKAVLFIPNVITVNDDQFNQFFTLFRKTEIGYRVYDGPDPFAMFIFNRWGEQVYYSLNPVESWMAEDHSSGVYFYHITLGELEFKGTMSVIK